MEKIFVDTSAWVALFVRNDKNHHRAASIFDKIKKNNLILYTSDYVIDETITMILTRSNHERALITGEALLESSFVKIIYVVPDYLQTTWELFKKYKDKKFSFTDVSCFAIMRGLKLRQAFSFDHEFVQAGIELIG